MSQAHGFIGAPAVDSVTLAVHDGRQKRRSSRLAGEIRVSASAEQHHRQQVIFLCGGCREKCRSIGLIAGVDV
jgi:hypothetical protein